MAGTARRTTGLTFAGEVPVFEAIKDGFDKVVEPSHNLCEARISLHGRDGLREHVRHWTDLRTAGLSGSGKRAWRVRASCCSLSRAWK